MTKTKTQTKRLTQHIQDSPESVVPESRPMSDLLGGPRLEEMSRETSPETQSAVENDKAPHQSAKPPFADQRALLLARLGIRSGKTDASAGGIDMYVHIASLSCKDEKKRMEAAHTIADLYEQLPTEKQMHARINLILMTWRDASASARIAAIKALGRIKMPDTSDALQVALRDEEPDVRAAAARALGEIRGPMPVVALIAAAEREGEHWSVRAAALRAMGQLGERVFLNTISHALDDGDDSVRIAAIHALAQVEGLQAAPRLALIARQDKQPHVKHAAILALENLSEGDDKRHTE